MEDRIQTMLLEKDKIITDYDNYIDNMIVEKERLKGMETMVRKLEQEKAYLEEEIEKVRMIKLMLENQLSAYSDNAEIKRLKQDNERLTNEVRRIKNTIASELGMEEDPNRLDMQTVITRFRSHFQNNIHGMNDAHALQRRNEELEDKLRYAMNDQTSELSVVRNRLKIVEDENMKYKQKLNMDQTDMSSNSSEAKRRIAILENENNQLKSALNNVKSTVNTSNQSTNNSTEIYQLQQKIRTLEGSPNAQLMAQLTHLQGELQLANEKARRERERNDLLEARAQELSRTMNLPPGTQGYVVTETRETRNGPAPQQNMSFSQKPW